MSFPLNRTKMERHFPPVSPCQHDHDDDGKIEGFMRAARTAFHYERSHEETVALLLKSGATLEQAHNAARAAKMLQIGDGGY